MICMFVKAAVLFVRNKNSEQKKPNHQQQLDNLISILNTILLWNYPFYMQLYSKAKYISNYSCFNLIQNLLCSWLLLNLFVLLGLLKSKKEGKIRPVTNGFAFFGWFFNNILCNWIMLRTRPYVVQPATGKHFKVMWTGDFAMMKDLKKGIFITEISNLKLFRMSIY